MPRTAWKAAPTADSTAPDVLAAYDAMCCLAIIPRSTHLCRPLTMPWVISVQKSRPIAKEYSRPQCVFKVVV
jgi:hypothetical protein